MLKVVPEILKRSSENIAGLSWVGGFVLLFLSFVDLHDFKSITVYATPFLGPLVAGTALILAAFLLRMVEKRKLGTTENPGDHLTDRLVFLLRHYDSLGESNFEHYMYFAQALFEYDHPGKRLTETNREAWQKVSDYAARYMALLGLLEIKGPEYAINAEGRRLVGTGDFRAKNARSFAKQLASLP